MDRSRRAWSLLLLIAMLLLVSIPLPPPAASRGVAVGRQAVSTQARAPEDVTDFARVPPIWASASGSAEHEVVLFRQTMQVAQPLPTTLAIFADTRYEIWLDGVWLGRGPARFSDLTHEYDTYDLGNLAPGEHMLAVLAQWAPNTRRSESTTPMLQVQVEGILPGGRSIITRTGSDWKALRSTAWRQDSAPVHSWGLIGPTELLDLRQLPANWMSPSYSDQAWPAAVVKSLTSLPSVAYRRRSIPMLAQVPMPATVNKVGALAPGWTLGELAPRTLSPYTVSFRALRSTEFVLDVVLRPGYKITDTVLLDGQPLAWSAVTGAHPDISRTMRAIDTGVHTLVFSALPPEGLTFKIRSQNLELPALPFQQGDHAGRRLLLADTVVQPESVRVTATPDGLDIAVARTPSFVVLDLGRAVHGRLVADVVGPGGTVVDIGWDERMWRDRRPLPYPGSLHPEWNQTDSWILDGSTRRISTIDARTGRYILLTVWGSGVVHLRNLQVVEERYPVTQRGSFQSPNARLNRIWQVGVDTLYPNMTDAYADPWRERGQWWGDAYVDDQINQVAFGDQQLLRRGIGLMSEAVASSGRPEALAPNGDGNHMLDYAMLWVASVHDYWRQTGDQEVPRQALSTIHDFMDFLSRFEDPDTGLMNIPLGHWSQTVYIEASGYSNRYGRSTAVNAIYYRTLLNAADISEVMGDDIAATTWRLKAAAVKDAINTYLFSADQQRYLTSIRGEQVIAPSPQAQAWALAFGVVPEDRVESVVAALLQLLSSDPARPNMEIYGMFWVLEALGRTGHIPEALQIIERYYGHMLDLGATTWWEGFNANLNYNSSLSHGWGGSPTWFLTSYVLGLRRTGPASWAVRQHYLGPQVYAGRLPLSNGDLQVRWESQGCALQDLTLAAPEETSGVVIIPQPDPSLKLTLNGTAVWSEGTALADDVVSAPEGVALSLPAGEHTLQISRTCYSTHLPLVMH